MKGAAAFGDIGARGVRALAAGCDVLPVCNDPASAIALVESLKVAPDPVSRLRLVRLHGRDAALDALASDPRWQAAAASARELVERPALQLEGDRPA